VMVGNPHRAELHARVAVGPAVDAIFDPEFEITSSIRQTAAVSPFQPAKVRPSNRSSPRPATGQAASRATAARSGRQRVGCAGLGAEPTRSVCMGMGDPLGRRLGVVSAMVSPAVWPRRIGRHDAARGLRDYHPLGATGSAVLPLRPARRGRLMVAAFPARSRQGKLRKFGNTQPTFRAARLRCPLVIGMATLGAAAGEVRPRRRGAPRPASGCSPSRRGR
jgi:hypothetical protein